MKSKDLLGFGKASEKLIEELSKGIGTLYEPLGRVFNTMSDSYRIKKLTDVASSLISESNEVVITNESFELRLKENKIEARAIEAIVRDEVYKQINLDSIVTKALQLIENKKNISEEPVDIDWMRRFIHISKNISNEEMQNLWAQILSNEVSHPNSYSLRTLETLRTMSANEAKLYSRFVNIIFKIQDLMMVIYDTKYLESNNISIDDLSLLKELNLINTDLGYEIEANEKVTLEYGDEILTIDNKTKESIHFSIITLSRIGAEIHSLIEKDYESSNLEGICKFIESQVFLDKDNFNIIKD